MQITTTDPDSDLTNNHASAEVTVLNSPPEAEDDNAYTDEDTEIDLIVLGNDDDSNGDSLTITAVGKPANGTASTDGFAITYTPTRDFAGVDVLSYTVSDGLLTGTATVTVTVAPINDPPTIDDIPDQSTQEGTSIGPIGFVVGDIETPAGGLTLLGTSSNTELVPDSNIVFGGSGDNRTVTVTPVAGVTGTVTITVTVDDGTDTASDHLTLRVRAQPFRVYLPTVIRQYPEAY